MPPRRHSTALIGINIKNFKILNTILQTTNASQSSKSNKAKSSWVKKTTVVKSTTTDTSDTDGDDAKKQSNAAEKLSVNLSAKNKFIDASIGKITIRQMSNGDEDNFTDAEENHDGDRKSVV